MNPNVSSTDRRTAPWLFLLLIICGQSLVLAHSPSTLPRIFPGLVTSSKRAHVQTRREQTATATAIYLPFLCADSLVDVRRAMLWTTDATGHIRVVSLATGEVVKDFETTNPPESIAMRPDGSRIYIALLHQSHSSYWWDEDQSGTIAEFDPNTLTHTRDYLMQRSTASQDFETTRDPYDLVATDAGYLFIASGSGQWTDIQGYNATTGALTSSAMIRQTCHLSLRPDQHMVFYADTDSSPSDIGKYDINAGVINGGKDSPYHGDHRMSGNVWCSSDGKFVVTRGGDAFTADAGMTYLGGVSSGVIADAAFSRTYFVTAESDGIHSYDLITRQKLCPTLAQAGVTRVFLYGNKLAYLTVNNGSTVYIVDAPINENAVNVTLPASFTEGDGLRSGGGTVSIRGTAATDLSVNLTSSLPEELAVPASVTIPAGASNATFDVTIGDDTVLDGTRYALLTAAAAKYENGQATVAVRDNEKATLYVSVPASVNEAPGKPTYPGLISVDTAPALPIVVTLTSDDTSEATVPAQVSIPAGQLNAPFLLTVQDDAFLDAEQVVHVTAHVDNWTDGVTALRVIDDEATKISFHLPAQVLEGSGVQVNGGSVSIPYVRTADLPITLFSSDAGELGLPTRVTIPAGQTSVQFNLTIPDDAEQDGTQTITCAATALGYTCDGASVRVLDNDLQRFIISRMLPQEATVPFLVSITAVDVNGDPLTSYQRTATLSVLTAGGNAIAATPTTLAFRNGSWSGQVTINSTQPLVSLHVADANGIATQSATFSVAAAPVVLPFAFTDMVADAQRARLWLTDKANKLVYVVNLNNRTIRDAIATIYPPESLALRPNGNRLYVALLTGEHSYTWWEEDQTGVIAEFDPAAVTMLRTFPIVTDPCSLAATDAGYLFVASGSGQWTYFQGYDTTSGGLLSTVSSVYMGCRFALRPDQRMLFYADTNSSPSDIGKCDINGGILSNERDSPYHGDHRMNGNVWCAASGQFVVTRGGDAFTADANMTYLGPVSIGNIADAAFGPSYFVTAEADGLHFYDATTRAKLADVLTRTGVERVAIWGDQIVYLTRNGNTTLLHVVKSPLGDVHPLVDMLIKTETENAFIGGDVFNLPDEQTKAAVASPNQPAHYTLRVENAGDVEDRFLITCSGVPVGWNVNVFDCPERITDITDHVTRDGWLTPRIAPGTGQNFTLDAFPDEELAADSQLSMTISASSERQPNTSDAVVAQVTANPPLRAVTLTTDLLSPQAINTPITLTATAVCRDPVQFRFRAGYQDAAGWHWTELRDYSTTASCIWTPAEARLYTLVTLARTQGSMRAYDVMTTTTYRISNSLAGVKLTATPPAPQPLGTPITLTAIPTGGGQVEYLFRAGYQDVAGWHWSVIREYGATAVCPWTPTDPHLYTLVVWAREAGSTKPYTVTDTLAYRLNPPPITAITLAVTPTSPQVINTPVQLTATAAGGWQVEYLFRAGRQDATGWHWTEIRGFHTANTCSWTPLSAGTYTLVAYTREVGSLAAYQQYATCVFKVAPAR